MTLTKAEQEKISRNRKLTRPQWYDSSKKQNVTISTEFEEFLILQQSKTLTDASDWFKKAKSLNRPNQDRDAIALQSATQLLNNMDAELKVCGDSISSFEKFWTQFQDPRYGGATEVGRIMSDIQRVIGEVVNRRDQAYYMKVLVSLLKDSLTNTKNDQDFQKELESWSLITSYVAKK